MFLLVDPVVLHLPELATTNQIDYFFNYLRNWNHFIRTNQGNHTFSMTTVCRNALGAEYPSRNSLQDLTRQSENRVFDANTGYATCQHLLQAFAGWPPFEDLINLPADSFAFDDEDMCLDPDLVERVPENIAESLQETFAYVAYAKEIANNPKASSLLFLTHPIANSDKIGIDVHLLIDNPGAADANEWQHTQTDLPIVGSPEDLLGHINLTDIWQDTRQAINWAVIRHVENKPISPYAVAPGFNDSLGNCQFPKHSSRLARCFEKIAQLLAGNPMSNDYELRTGEGPGDPQMEQKVGTITWKARRLRITSGSGAVYRLHYWTAGNEYIFSNVVSKNDSITIYEIDEEIVKQIK